MPKLVDHEAYRCTLLRASFDIVARVGYGSLSMKQLAQCLEISTGLIYHYFKGKEDWFVSLVAHYSGEVFALLTQEVPSEAPLSEKPALLMEHVDRHKDLYANLISVASDYVRMPGAEGREGVLEMAMAGGRLYDFVATLFETSETTARALVSHLIGVVVTNRLDGRGVDVSEQLPYVRAVLGQDGPWQRAGGTA